MWMWSKCFCLVLITIKFQALRHHTEIVQLAKVLGQLHLQEDIQPHITNNYRLSAIYAQPFALSHSGTLKMAFVALDAWGHAVLVH